MKPNEQASRAQQSKLVTSSSNTSSQMAVHLASFDNLGFTDTMAESVRAIMKIDPLFDACLGFVSEFALSTVSLLLPCNWYLIVEVSSLFGSLGWEPMWITISIGSSKMKSRAEANAILPS
jgi:hypothetical protein